MKDKSFAMAMGKIVAQAEAEQQQEIRAQKRAAVFGRVRSVCVFLFIAAVLVSAFTYRDKLETIFNAKPQSNGPTGQVSASLKAARQNAATRDDVVADVSK